MKLPVLSAHFFTMHTNQSKLAGGLLFLLIGLELSALSDYFPFRLFWGVSAAFVLTYIVLKMKVPCQCKKVWVAKNSREVVLTIAIPVIVIATFAILTSTIVIFSPLPKFFYYFLSSIFLVAGTALLVASRWKLFSVK